MTGTTTLRTVVAVQTVAFTAIQRVRHARQSTGTDDGLTTLEIVLWAVGLFAAASLAIGIITAAINSRVRGIQ